jgi:hypothetical protein
VANDWACADWDASDWDTDCGGVKPNRLLLLGVGVLQIILILL